MLDLENMVERAQAGERDAVEALLASHRQAVFSLAFSFLREPRRAEEAAQEAFIKIFTRLPSLDKPKRFRSWAMTITANHCRDVLRKKSPLQVSLEQAPELATSAEPGQSNEMSETVEAALDTLNPELRQAVLLRDVENFSYREISDIQKIALGTVKSRIYEARRKLRKWISQCTVTR